MPLRITAGRAAAVDGLRAAGALAAALAAPVPARPPWLVTVLTAPAGPLSRPRPLTVAVGPAAAPEALAVLARRRRGTGTAVRLLGQDTDPQPGGRAPARLLARDDDAAAALADGLVRALDGLRGPWRLELGGLGLGDPTVRRLAAALPTSRLTTARSTALVDELDTVGEVGRHRSAAEVDRVLPAVLARLPRSSRPRVRALVRLHAAIGQVEVAVLSGPDGPRAVLLTLLDGDDRWPWWGSGAGLTTRRGTPLVTLRASSERSPGR